IALLKATAETLDILGLDDSYVSDPEKSGPNLKERLYEIAALTNIFNKNKGEILRGIDETELQETKDAVKDSINDFIQSIDIKQNVENSFVEMLSVFLDDN